MNIIIVGAGKIATQLVNRLSLDNSGITIIEKDQEIASFAREKFDALVINGDATDYSLLCKANTNRADVFVALTRSDEANILACKIAKRMGVPTTIARIRNPQFMEANFLLTNKEMGVDFFIHPERETADAIIRLVKQAVATDIVEIEEGIIQFIGLRMDSQSQILNLPLMDLEKQLGNLPLRILAIKRSQFTIIPRGTDRIIKGDQLFFICENSFINKALELFGKVGQKMNNIMIIGGGLIGGFIANGLEHKYNIKIIEILKDKAIELADKLDRSLVIHGDGSDVDLLNSEYLTEMDEVISVTGNDETNIITGVIARHLQVPRTISLLRKTEYLVLAAPLGLDAVVSKEQITANTIEKFIRRKKIQHITTIPGLDAEILEYEAGEKSRIIKKPLKDVNFPKNAIVGAIYRNNREVIIPRGTTLVKRGDKVVVCVLPSAVNDVEKMF